MLSDSEKNICRIVIGRWKEETMYLSSTEHDNRNYRAIVAWGKHRPDDFIPFLLEVIQESWHWSGALRAIVGEGNGPHIPEEHAGRASFIVQAWLAWGKANGYL